jgi:hypothetical protein
MPKILFTNNATSRLRIAVPAGSSTITVDTGHGAKFPTPAEGSGDYFMVTLEDRRTGQIEICKATGRSGDILQVVRAQEGTVAQDFLPGAVASSRITAGIFDYFQFLAESAGGYTKLEADARFIDVAGDAMEGPLELPVEPTIPEHATNKFYVDEQIQTRSPVGHHHVVTDVDGLTEALAGKAPTNHSHSMDQVNGLNSALSNLQSEIDANEANLIAEANARVAADNAEVTARNTAIANSATTTLAAAEGNALALAIALG